MSEGPPIARHEGTALVIGGTGMLAVATHWLADRHERTLLVARRAKRFAGNDARFLALELDWKTARFVEEIEDRLGELPALTTALIWLHQPERLIGQLAPLLAETHAVLVLGSMDGRPAIPTAAAGLVTVRLGSLATGSGRRWLTNDEISAAAIASLKDTQSRIVGELSPIG